MKRIWPWCLIAALAPACSGAIGEGDETPGDGTPAKPGAPGTTGSGGAGGTGNPSTPRPPPVNCGPSPTVGNAPMRRLSREQYANAVRDLVGVRPATDSLTPDENVGPFFSNAVAATTDLVTQQYMESAERIARTATTTLDRLVPCSRMGMGDEACIVQFIDGFGRRAYRRPLTADEKTRYRTLFGAYFAIGGFAGGVRGVVQTMLQSPHFLYHVEFAEGPAGATGVVPLGPFALASRLSFFAWNSIPDEMLLQAAASGALADPRNLRAQLERMLRDPRARDAMSSFHLQWLDVDGIGGIAKDTRVFPLYSSAVRTAMRNETVAFTDWVVRQGDAKLETLLTAPFSFLEAPLYPIYGLPPAPAADPSKPTQLDPQQRAGLLTQASFLAMHAHANQSSPVARGVLVRKNLLCQSLPDPPPDVNNTPPDPKPNLTTRERFAIHEKDPACAGCHLLIDQIGFGFENYDGIGVYRTTESGKPIDARGKIVSTTDLDGEFVGAVDLARRLAKSRQVRECVAKQWFRFALGRIESEADACTVARMLDAFEGAQQDVRALLGALAVSDAFRHRRAPSP